MRVARRLISLLVLIGVAAALVNFYGWPQQWLGLQIGDLTRLVDRRAATNVSPESLPAYTRTVAGKPWFQSYFTRLAFSDQDGANSFTGRLTKWDKRRVRIDVLNDGGPGMDDYVQHLVRRLNRMQSATRFTIADGRADITIEYVSHAAYARTLGAGSVGNCETRFYSTTPGLIEAAITIDAGVLDRKSVV